jgi:hypothetical protein
MPSNRSKCNTPENTDAEKVKKFSSKKFDWIRGVITDQRYTYLQRCVAIEISYCFDKHTYAGSEAQTKIAARLGCTRQAVQEAIKALEAGGHLGVQPAARRGEENTYRMLLPDAEEHVTFDDEISPEALTPMPTHVGTHANRHWHDMPTHVGTTCQPPLAHNTPSTPLKTPNTPDEESIDRSSEEDTGQSKDRVIPQNGFEEFWRAYPRKEGSGYARDEYVGILKSKKATAAELLAGAERYAQERNGQDPKFTKHAKTWLKGECWLDEPVQSTPCPWTDRNYIDGRL